MRTLEEQAKAVVDALVAYGAVLPKVGERTPRTDYVIACEIVLRALRGDHP